MRNELHTAGKYQIPLIRKQEIDFDTISLLSYVQTKGNDEENAYKIVHFSTHDWLFDKVYDKAFDEAEKLMQYYSLLSPDFSMFTDINRERIQKSLVRRLLAESVTYRNPHGELGRRTQL